MNLLNVLTGGLTGFVAGGPLGAAAGAIAGGLSREPSGVNQDTSRSSLTGTGDDLRNFLRRQAYMAGVRSVLGGASGASQPSSAQRANVGGSNVGRGTPTRTDQQRGGSGFPYPSGGDNALGANNEQLLREYIAGGLAGVGGPQANVQGQYALGRNVINAQAQQSRAGLMETLAQRGMLRSGALSTGLADVERARLGSLQGLMGQISGQRLQAAQLAQQQAASLMAGQVGQTQQIAATQPTFADYLAELAGAYAQSRYPTERFDLAALWRELRGTSEGTGTPLRWDEGG